MGRKVRCLCLRRKGERDDKKSEEKACKGV